MKKKLLFTILTFLFMFVGVANVYAADPTTLTQADFTQAKNHPDSEYNGITYDAIHHIYDLHCDADYILSGSINLDNGEGRLYLDHSNITLNNAIINGSIETQMYSDNSISGSGSISGELDTSAGNTTIDGSITFGDTYKTNGGNVVINGGTFNKGFAASNDAVVIINDGIFKSGQPGYYKTAVDNLLGSDITIKGGTFSGDDAGIGAYGGGKVTIYGGTFTGGMAGLYVNSTTDVTLYGGTFKTTGAAPLGGKTGAIALGSSFTFDQLLADGYRYTASPDYVLNNYNYLFLTANEISVEKIVPDTPSDDTTLGETTEEKTEEKKEETNNPKTGDSFYLYITMFIASYIGFVITRKRYN